jgi:hypothetical protein
VACSSFGGTTAFASARAPDILNRGQIHVILVDNNNVEKDGWYFKHFRTGTIGRL